MMNSRSGMKIKFIAAMLGVTVWALFTGYFQVFSFFPFHQDEGYLMITVKQLLDGKTLYDQIYTQYGPAYYLYEQIIYAVSGMPVTHDFTRLMTLAVWTLISLLGGVFTFRLTRSTLFGAMAYVLTFLILFRTVYEPGHPQELCGLLVILILLLLTNSGDEKKFRVSATLAAVCLAFLFLTKVNLGIFLGLAFAVALLSFIKPNGWQRIALFALTALAVALPFIILRKYLALGWIKLCIALAVSVSAIVLNGSLKPSKPFVSIKFCLALAAAFAGVSVLIILAFLLQGTSLSALIYGTFIQHLKFGDNFFQAAPIQRFVIYWSLLAFALAFGIAFLKQRQPRTAETILVVLKSAFGLGVIASSLWGYELFLNNFALLSFAPPFLWLLLVKTPGVKNGAEFEEIENGDENYFARIVLFFSAITLTLQIFPIAGTQMAYACYLIIIVGVVCLFEGSVGAARLFPRLAENFIGRYGLTTAAIVFLIGLGAYRSNKNYVAYRDQTPVEFVGTTRLRIPIEKAALYTFLVENLRADCDSFVSMPGLFSLNFWANSEPPTTYNATAWLTLLDDAQQRAIIEKLKTYPRPCAVYYPKLTTDGLRNRQVESFPLARYILNDFKIAATAGEHRLMIARNAAAKPIYLAKILPNRNIEFTFPNRRDWQIARVQIFDWQQKRVLADSRDAAVSISDENAQTESLPLTIAANAAAPSSYELTLPASNQTELPPPENLILRFYDGDGNLIAFLPFDETRR